MAKVLALLEPKTEFPSALKTYGLLMFTAALKVTGAAKLVEACTDNV